MPRFFPVHEYDANGGTARQESIEKVDREVARDTAIREEAPPYLGAVAPLPRQLIVKPVKRHRPNESGKAEAHASDQHNRKCSSNRKWVEIGWRGIRERHSVPHKVGHDPRRKQFLKLGLTEVMMTALQWQLERAMRR